MPDNHASVPNPPGPLMIILLGPRTPARSLHLLDAPIPRRAPEAVQVVHAKRVDEIRQVGGGLRGVSGGSEEEREGGLTDMCRTRWTPGMYDPQSVVSPGDASLRGLGGVGSSERSTRASRRIAARISSAAEVFPSADRPRIRSVSVSVSVSGRSAAAVGSMRTSSGRGMVCSAAVGMIHSGWNCGRGLVPLYVKERGRTYGDPFCLIKLHQQVPRSPFPRLVTFQIRHLRPTTTELVSGEVQLFPRTLGGLRCGLSEEERHVFRGGGTLVCA